MLKAKKSLGQNFLKSKKVLDKIVSVSELSKKDLVLEIGPGRGALTKKILEQGVKVLAIEKDARLISVLEEKFFKEIKSGQLKIFEGDALEINYKILNLKNKKFKVVANLPYYITGKFLSNILSNEIKPSLVVLMLQKAVVERIAGKSSAFSSRNKKENFKESLLSLSIKVYGKPEFIMPVSAKNFKPIPKVDSAVLKISQISKDFFSDNKIEEEEFFHFLKTSFSSKRKKIIKNLKTYTQNSSGQKNFSDKENLEKIFDNLKIDKNVRAEDLDLENFKNIFKFLKNH